MTLEPADRALTDYPVVERSDGAIRAFRDDVLVHLDSGGPLVDVRSPGEFSGELMHMPDYPQEGALRGGHIPGASNVPWKMAANDDGTFKARDELEAIYQTDLGLGPNDQVAVQPHSTQDNIEGSFSTAAPPPDEPLDSPAERPEFPELPRPESPELT